MFSSVVFLLLFIILRDSVILFYYILDRKNIVLPCRRKRREQDIERAFCRYYCFQVVSEGNIVVLGQSGSSYAKGGN